MRKFALGTALAFVLTVLAGVPGGAQAPPYASITSALCSGANGLLPPCNFQASAPPNGPGNEVHVAVNPLDPFHLIGASKDYGLGKTSQCGAYRVWAGIYASFDGGLTWKTSFIPGYPGDTRPSPLAGIYCSSDPVVAFGPDGTAYFLGLAYGGTVTGGVYVARSPDGGVTWPGEEITWAHRSNGDDKQWFAIDSQSGIHVVWIDFGSCGLCYTRSGPTYGTWTTPLRIGPWGGGNPAVEVATGPDDEVYITWRNGDVIHVLRSTNGGASFQARTPLVVRAAESWSAPRAPFMPQVTVDKTPTSPFAGTVYLTWTDRREGTSDVYFAYSRDGAASWSTPVRLNDPGTREGDERYPAITVAPSGSVHVAWMDARNSGSFRLADQYYTRSDDGGVTWTQDVKVSLQASDSKRSFHQSGSEFIGDYNGIAASDAFAHPAWACTLFPASDGRVPPGTRADECVATLDAKLDLPLRAPRVAPPPSDDPWWSAVPVLVDGDFPYLR